MSTTTKPCRRESLLVELDPSDDQVALQQSQAQYDQAMAQLERIASQPAHHAHQQQQRSHLAAGRGSGLRGRTRRSAA